MFEDPKFWLLVSFVLFVILMIKPFKSMLIGGLDQKIEEIKSNINSSLKSFSDAETKLKEAEKQNSSFYKIDVPIGLKLDYLLGDFNDGFQSRTYLNSRVLSTFGRGTEFEFDFLNI